MSRCRPVALCVSLLILPALLRAGGLAPDRPAYLLDQNARLFVWLPGQTTVQPISLPWPSVNDLAPFAAGRRLLILTDNPGNGADQHAQGDRHRKGERHDGGEGLAVLMQTDGATLVPSLKIPFEGRGLRAAVTGDGRRAYILAYRDGRSSSTRTQGQTDAGPGAFIHALDLEQGLVVDSLSLSRPATSIALAPGGKRLFVALPDRILSCSTSPLASSWFYRSPGVNLGLAFRPGSDVLFAVRGRQVALFDPEVLAALSEQERHMRDDNATSMLALPEAAAALLFSEDGRLAVAYGGTEHLTFLDSMARVATSASLPAGFPERPALVRPFRFSSAEEDLLVAVFPEGGVLAIPHPPTSVTVGPEAAAGPSAPGGAAPGPSVAAPGPSVAAPGPEVAEARPRAVNQAVLRGHLIGEHQRVAAIVVFGPNSILKEQVRVVPGPDGAWSVPLPPPGTYRIVPIGEASRPVRTIPNFQTVVVKGEAGLEGVDFVVERSP